MIGKNLNGRYELLEKIGEGGMAYVYRAKCHLLNRDVAIKILKKEFSNDENIVGKFKGEAAAAAGLCGNNIVNIYDVGTENDTNYIVMELVEGKTLKELIHQEGAINEKKAIDIAIQIGKALQSAHNKRIIHRDIKPHNIIVNENGGIKVADFGIAKAIDQSTITNTSKVMGTAHYFSPEQAKGGYVDFRSDIYSFGIVLYEMVTGRVPYDADSIVSVAIKHLQEEVVPPKKVNDKISEGLNSVILKCIEKDPGLRYQTADELIVDLYNLKNNKEIIVKKKVEDIQQTRVMNVIKDEDIKIHNKNKKDSKNDKKDKKNKLGIIVGVSIILLFVLSSILTWAFIYFKDDENNIVKKEKTIVPFIVGQKLEDSIKLIEERKLTYSVVREAKSDREKGTIIKCTPEEGVKVEENTELSLVISKGSEGVKVKSYKGFNIDTIKGVLPSHDVALGKITKEHANLEKGKIINQSPEPGTIVEKGYQISFVVSSGPEIEQIKVPILIGKKINEAKELIESKKLKIGVISTVETNDPNKDGLVFSQSPEGELEVTEESKINLSHYIFKEDGRERVIVPSFINMQGIEADMKAFETGIKVEIKGESFDLVVEQSVAPGEWIYAGETVTLTTKKEEEE
ncbi:Stk1 family PASTA domain-containing Ser/Thr kinase [Oceanirhabdus sp. W0125-5]|uniref:Stk1 family PASTA domain-containing Ser/Thr kinase n=1 Tax=Oceanirhabdus sp. W0125-5 TaxID=2999116 RepID=UPI0022F31711|nr:Stk1 family PASTA domain-containing Ser/Thr kinase [Oceanirhabdus sp. W0125-5]WBW94785.1 Stk1 family PASTA domain-containing Ser/Thr kinase [Oceanirhabdus sp. W0125-5]